VRRLIAGSATSQTAYICDECIGVRLAVIRETKDGVFEQIVSDLNLQTRTPHRTN